jgi:hypothetical protein
MQDLQLTVSRHGTAIVIEHNYALTPVRQAILETKQHYLLSPLKKMLAEHSALADNWADSLRLALLCCPLLTVNLLDERRIPPAIAWLGLSLAVEMGNWIAVGEEHT